VPLPSIFCLILSNGARPFMQALHEIRSLISRHASTAHADTQLSGLRLLQSSSPTPPKNSMQEPAFALIAQGRKRTSFGKHVLEYGAGDYLVVPVTVPTVGQVVEASQRAPYQAVVMTLRREAIVELTMHAGQSRGAEGNGTAVGKASDKLLDAVARLLRLFEEPSDIAVLQPMIEREILWYLLGGPQGALLRQIGLTDSRLSHVNRAMQWIRSHYSETMRTELLEELTGMSAASLFRHFRALTGMSPLQYQKQIRLHEARTRLVSKEGEVAAVGFAVGYESPSQFSREYHRLFGLPPKADKQRLQALFHR
jgi:AraC-like DNA-binding protein